MKKMPLSIEEKASLLIGEGFWTIPSCGGKVYPFVVSDGPAGVRHPSNVNATGDEIPSICYPFGQSLANTWNLEIARKIGNAIANDCIEQNVDILLAPGVNIKRLPICGRNFEYFSEDPLLAGLMGREYIRGVEEKHVGTSLKHFCCNNVEYSRHWISSEVDERTLHEIYLVPFELALEAKPMTVMSSYNLVNGLRMSEHKKLYDLLRGEFKFDGAIVSDWEAVKDRVASLKAGLDLEMPYNEEQSKKLASALEKGTLPLDKVDESASRVVSLASKCEENKKLAHVDMSVKEREAVALEGAEESIVLLKNESALPLKGDERILVTGAPNNYRYFGGGSSAVKMRFKYVPLSETLKQYAPNAFYSESVISPRGHSADMGNLKEAVRESHRCDVSIVCVGDNDACESESFDRQHIKLAKEEEDAILSIAEASKKTIVIVYAGSAIDMSAWIEKVDAIIYAGYGGEFINEALAEVLVGKVNPSGKLSETFPLSLDDVLATHSYRDENCLVYSEGLNVGYRYFDTFKKPVLFPFGFGLSYSSFIYSDLRIGGEGCDLTVSFQIENVSDVPGKEVAEIYVRELDKEVYRPNKELKAFQKVFVPSHGKRRVEMKLNERSFAYYSTALNGWKVHEGLFEVEVCSDAQNVRLSQRVEIKKD